MEVRVYPSKLKGHISVPGSKSHTIRALLLAAMSQGECHIYNPLESADCKSAFCAIPLIGAAVTVGGAADNICWTVVGAGDRLHLPDDVVNVGNSGSLLYFMSPIAATFPGYSIFTGDESIRTRPIGHVLQLLNAMGATATGRTGDSDTPPLIIKGAIRPCHATTVGTLSQYISGVMMAATRLEGTTTLSLTAPGETPYLTMTRLWLDSLGVDVRISGDFTNIAVKGPANIPAFTRTIPSDWEAVAFPLIAALMTGSSITIDNVDGSGTQGDAAIVDVLKSVGAPLVWDKSAATLLVDATPATRLSTEGLPDGVLRVALGGYPDAICALAVIATFIEGTTILEDISVCRKKETDRVTTLVKELRKVGATIEDTGDALRIIGHSPVVEGGAFTLHPATLNSYKDHRLAMAFTALGLALKGNSLTVILDSECATVSFPHYYDVLRSIGADIR